MYPGYLFGDEISCILAPETSQDAFFISGEAYRQDIIEDQAGVNLTTVMKFIDVDTCLPVKDLCVSFWNSNAEGVYSGVVGTEVGQSADSTNQDTAFLRGLVQTDMYGLATFTTIFPGHYAGRTPHLNVLAEYNGTYRVTSVRFDVWLVSSTVTASSRRWPNAPSSNLTACPVAKARAASISGKIRTAVTAKAAARSSTNLTMWANDNSAT